MRFAPWFLAVGGMFFASCASVPAPAVKEARTPMRVDVRDLRLRLSGGNAADVARKLGPPGYVTALGEREVWEYRDVVVDSLTKRPVALLEVEFAKRRVTGVNFVY